MSAPEPASRPYACAQCGETTEVPAGRPGAVWCPCGSPEPMAPDVAVLLVSGTLEALGHILPPPPAPVDVPAIMAFYERAAQDLGCGLQDYIDAVGALAEEAAAAVLPWARSDADVLGDIRAAMEAGSAVPAALGFPAMLPPGQVTIPSTDSPARISPEVSTRADQDRSVQIGDRTWTPGHP